jgi:hypothetical protein
MPAEIIQIVPRLAPSISGVADYAGLLAGRLRDDYEIQSNFLVGDPAWKGSSNLDGFNVHGLHQRRANELERQLKKLGAATVLLHYVGYGYQKRGCPVWLMHGLKSWKKRSAKHRLIVMFHELFATGLPWQSSFWSAPLQRHLCKSLASLSDHCVTNRRCSAQTLSAMTSRAQTDFIVLPVFSNVGELLASLEWRQRKPRMIVFGGAAWRRQAYFDRRIDLQHAIETFGIDEVVDIGPPCGDVPKLPVRHTVKGILGAESVDRELTEARAGFFTYPADYLGKSTIFAAYASHGLLPVTFAGNAAQNQDGLYAGEHFLRVGDGSAADPEKLTTISQQVYRWYRRHRLSEQTQCYASMLGKPSAVADSPVAGNG